MISNRNDRTSTTKDIIMVKTQKQTDTNESFYDIFDVLDDDDDDDDKMMMKQYAQLKEEFSLGYNFDYTHNNMEEEEVEVENENQSIIHDHDETIKLLEDDDDISSTRSSSHSFTTNDDDDDAVDQIELLIHRKKRPCLPINSESIIQKKKRTNIDDDDDDSPQEIDQMPKYLLAKNKLFDRMIEQNISLTTTHSMTIEDLRQIAFFIHYLNFYTILYDLWSVYLKAGTGQLRVNDEEVVLKNENPSINNHRPYWSKHVLSSFISEQDRRRRRRRREDADEQQLTYELLVGHRLSQYQDKIEHYQKQLDEKKSRHLLDDFTPIIEEKLQLFIEEQDEISSHRKKCHHAITMLHYDYNDQLLQDQYQEENPTDYQITVGQRLYDMNVQLEKMKYELMEIRERIRCNKPFASLDTLQISLPSYIHRILNGNIRQQLIYQHETLIQQIKTDLIAIYFGMIETKIAQYQTMIQQETDQMYENTRRHIPNNQEMPKIFIQLIDKRINNMNEKCKVQYDFLYDSYLRSPYGNYSEKRIHGKEMTFKRIGFLPNMIMDWTTTTTTLPDTVVLSRSNKRLTNEQLRLLQRGPTYVSPCQWHLSFPSIDDRMKKQYQPLIHKMAILFSEYHISLPIAEQIKMKIKKEFRDSFSIPPSISSELRQRALYEKKLIQSIRSRLKENNLLLRRTSNQMNTFYLGDRDDFHLKSNHYMQQHTDHYTILLTLNDKTNAQKVLDQEMKKRGQLINVELEKLFQEKRFSRYILKQLQLKIENLKLPYLYFLPDVSSSSSPPTVINNHHQIQVKPIISAHHSATSKIAKFLSRILQPIITHAMKQTQLMNEGDFIQKLHSYTYQQHRLQPTTLFATLKMTNFHTLVSHRTMIDRLGDFLRKQFIVNQLEYRTLKSTVQPQYISINTIRILTELFLENNIFYYNNDLYQCIKGAPNTLVFSETLSTIYLCLWEEFIFQSPYLTNEFYGRYKDQIFLTWNRSKDELITFLQTIRNQNPTMQLDIFLGQSVHFFDAHIENRHGQLYTSIYHHPSNMEKKYSMPYVVDHTKFSHRHWFRSALIRAVRFCSNVDDFLQERIYLEMACLMNGYSNQFIETQLKHFYHYFNATTIRFSMNQMIYNKFRDRLLRFIDEQRINWKQAQELEAHERVIYLDYFYQNGGSPEKFHQKFHQIWSNYLAEDVQLSNKKTRMILKAKHIYSLNALLAEQKPSFPLLLPSSNHHRN